MDHLSNDWKPRSTDAVSGRWWMATGARVMVILVLGAALVTGAALWSPSSPSDVTEGEGFSVHGSPQDLVSVRLPMEVNQRVEYWMRRYLTDQRPVFQLYLRRGEVYAEMIREKLRTRGMPEDLVYLAMIESGFSPRATSRVAAMGMWQFMSPTARAYGLRVDEYVDERRDPVRATDAALDYLERLHERFGSWYLAAAAYNAGPTRVARILRQHGSDDAGDDDLYWEVIELLPLETRAYVPKILAATLLAREAERHGFEVTSPEDRLPPYRFHRVFVPGRTSLAAVARALEVDPAAIRELNPHLVRGVTPPDISYPVRVPVGRAGQVVASLDRRVFLADD